MSASRSCAPQDRTSHPVPVLVGAFLLVLAYILSRLASTLSTHHTFLYSLCVEQWGRMARTSLCELCAWQMDDALLLLLYGKRLIVVISAWNGVREMPQFSELSGRKLWRQA